MTHVFLAFWSLRHVNFLALTFSTRIKNTQTFSLDDYDKALDQSQQ